MAGVRTFVLIGDGESRRSDLGGGAYAGAKKVRGLVGVIDMNGVQLASATAEAVPLEPIVDKWRAFGWTVIDVDGHAMGPLVEALEKARARSEDGPVMVVARTVKGKGVSFMEGRYEWHGKAQNDKEFELAMKEIGA
jgi:transketolase